MGDKKISPRVPLAKRKIKKEKKKKLVSIKSLRKKLDTEFNAYIRERDKKCILCGSTKKLQCSHFYGKHARPATRWNTYNAYAMCASCHFKHHHGLEADYAIKLIELFGLENIKHLQEQSMQPISFSRDDYELQIGSYKRLRAIFV
jgi:hypothetical protein